MALPFYNWSRVAGSNATADATVNWSEGQAPSSVNDSARAMMASTAGFRDDISGAIVTGGSATAYTVASYQVFDSLAHLSGQIIAFTPHTTNGNTVTLNVDGLGAKPLRSSPGVELPSGMLLEGTPYCALYNNSSAVFYLVGGNENSYSIPVGAGMDYWGTTAPNSAFALPAGQAISRTTYATLFALISTTYGVGDGSTTFNLPDKTGRVSAMKESSATRLTTTYFGVTSGLSGATLGAVGGLESQTLGLTQLPTGITSTGTVTVSGGGSGAVVSNGSLLNITVNNGSNTPIMAGNGTNSLTQVSSFSGSNTLTSNNTNGNPHANVQPTIICNYIMRII